MRVKVKSAACLVTIVVASGASDVGSAAANMPISGGDAAFNITANATPPCNDGTEVCVTADSCYKDPRQAACAGLGFVPPPPPPTGGSGGGGGGFASGSSPSTQAATNIGAWNVKCAIKMKSDYANVEYGAYLYIAADGYTAAMGPLTRGTQYSVSPTYPAGVPVSKIIALIHSHTQKACTDAGYTPTSEECQQTYAPSNPSTVAPGARSDWGEYNGSSYQVTWGYQHQIGLYMIDPDGKLRYFPPSDQTQSASGTEVTQSSVGAGSGC